MANDGVWVFVDDRLEEAKAFGAEFERSGLIRVEVLSPAVARSQLLVGRRRPAGVLMDVDLSAIADELGTGPGIAQDIRTKQKARLAEEFPIVRFSAAEPVQRNVLGDPSSDDLFESKILKNHVKDHRDDLVHQLLGLTQVYEALDALVECLEQPADALDKMFGIDAKTFSRWGHEALVAKILAGTAHAPHVAASVFARYFLIPYGLLIDSKMLALRVGVDTAVSGAAWTALLQRFDGIKYCGVAEQHFAKWWARGLEEWWFHSVDQSGPLAGKTAVERVEVLSKVFRIEGLAPLSSPVAQEPFRPWSYCRLGLERVPAEFIPVDPAHSVRMTPQSEFPSWVDQPYASLKLAMQARGDARLNQKDFHRLRKMHGV